MPFKKEGIKPRKIEGKSCDSLKAEGAAVTVLLEKMLEELTSLLGISMDMTPTKSGFFSLDLNANTSLIIKEYPKDFFLQSNITSVPYVKKEDLFMYLNSANFFGQGTGGAFIGIDEEEKNITFSMKFPHTNRLRVFKEHLEDFANYMEYWKTEIEKFKAENK